MNKNSKIEILQKMIQIPSVNDHEADVADYIISLFAPYPEVEFEKVEYVPGRDNLVVTFGDPTGPTFGLSGHMDVVAAGNEADWQFGPFSGTIQDGKVFGRGASDMKSGLAAVVSAMIELLETGTKLNGQIRLLATVGEETGEYGAAQLTKAGYADDLVGLIIAEPSTDMKEMVYTARGVIDYEVTSIGKGAHSARPWLGINAIDNLWDFYHLAKKRLSKFSHGDPILGHVTHEITKISGGEQVNSIPAQAKYMGNIRTIPEYPNKMFYAELESVLAELNSKEGYDLSLRYSFPEESIIGSADTPLAKTAAKIYQDVFHEMPKLTGSLGANDGAEFLQAKGDFNSLVCGPGSDTSHQANEYVDIAIYLKAIEFYKQLALKFVG
ncbi:ArgE/DapE family deacylase [Ligilactobacillus acidipiscis]|uniref:ArgE/DapE family deacylase n=1 Tax=Ligilactobacillus acidipiscis TaxID=89059 RepID=UPI0022DEB9FC|nr:ArgE/DapE family deacylase [Ligilactobacillus acidipiscis]